MNTCARDGCEKEFPPSTNGRRKYCSEQCRQYVHNHRSPERIATLRANAVRWRKANPEKWNAYKNAWARRKRAEKRGNA
jgi:hypothetical protein